MSDPTFIIHNLTHALAVGKTTMDVKARVKMQSAPGLASTLGPEAFSAIVEFTRASYPGAEFTAVLDCGDEPGTAIGALRRGIKTISINVDALTRRKIEDIAHKLNANVVNCAKSALDLYRIADTDINHAIRRHISNGMTL